MESSKLSVCTYINITWLSIHISSSQSEKLDNSASKSLGMTSDTVDGILYFEYSGVALMSRWRRLVIVCNCNISYSSKTQKSINKQPLLLLWQQLPLPQHCGGRSNHNHNKSAVLTKVIYKSTGTKGRRGVFCDIVYNSINQVNIRGFKAHTLDIRFLLSLHCTTLEAAIYNYLGSVRQQSAFKGSNLLVKYDCIIWYHISYAITRRLCICIVQCLEVITLPIDSKPVTALPSLFGMTGETITGSQSIVWSGCPQTARHCY